MTNAVTMYGSSNESVVVYQSEDGTLKLNVQLKEESVWLTQEQISHPVWYKTPCDYQTSQ